MKEEKIPYDKQIFVCTHDLKGEKPSCGDHQGAAIFKELRRVAKEKGLHPRIRVAQATCLGQCDSGTSIMVYPDDIWFKNVQLKDVDELIKKFFPE